MINGSRVTGNSERDHPLGSLLRGSIFQLSLDVRDSLPRPADAGAAVDQDGLLQALINLPNDLKFSLRKGGMLVVANWNMRNVESLRTIVRNQSDPQILVQSKLLPVQQADNGSNTVLMLAVLIQ